MKVHAEEKKEEVNINANEIVFSKNWETYRDEKYFDYRKKWSLYPKERIVSDFPLHLDIETTDLCNLKCPMCPRTILDEQNEELQKKKYISKEEYKNIIDQAVQYDIKSIKLQYLGEPLLHKEVVWQVEYAKQQGIIDVMFNTNATLLTKELSEQLLKAGLDKLFISFDAVSPKLYEQQRVGTTIGKVIDNIYNFIKLRNEISPKTHVRLSMVMYEDPIWKEQFDAMKVMWRDLVDALGYGIYIERDLNKQLEHDKVDGFCCEQLYQRMFLKCNGNVTVCCVDDKDEYIIGNWRNESLYDLWHNDKYTFIREKHKNNNYSDIAMCRKCYMPEIYKKTYSS